MSALDLGLVILSCDKYSDLWKPFFDTLFRAWPDCPFTIYLAANERRFHDSRVATLLSGPDTDWSRSVRSSVAQVAESNILFLYDDAFLTRRVSTESVCKYFAWFVSHNANYLRLRSLPRPDDKVDRDVGMIRPGSPFRTALFTSIWRKSLILDVLQDGESAWSFELEGVRRANAHGRFYGTYENVFSYVHGVEKGKWFPWSVRYLQRQGIEVDVHARSVMSIVESAKYLSRVPRGYVLRLLPPAWWPMVFAMKRSVQAALRSP